MPVVNHQRHAVVRAIQRGADDEEYRSEGHGRGDPHTVTHKKDEAAAAFASTARLPAALSPEFPLAAAPVLCRPRRQDCGHRSAD
jgi:hypothetical protein